MGRTEPAHALCLGAFVPGSGTGGMGVIPAAPVGTWSPTSQPPRHCPVPDRTEPHAMLGQERDWLHLLPWLRRSVLLMLTSAQCWLCRGWEPPVKLPAGTPLGAPSRAGDTLTTPGQDTGFWEVMSIGPSMANAARGTGAPGLPHHVWHHRGRSGGCGGARGDTEHPVSPRCRQQGCRPRCGCQGGSWVFALTPVCPSVRQVLRSMTTFQSELRPGFSLPPEAGRAAFGRAGDLSPN